MPLRSSTDETHSRFSSYFFSRFLWVGLILLAECGLVLSFPHPRFGVANYDRGAPFVFVVALIVFGAKQFLTHKEKSPIRYRFAVSNFIFVALFLFAGYRLTLLFPDTDAKGVFTAYSCVVIGIWAALLFLAVLSLILLVMPLTEAIGLARRLGPAWLYALGCALASIWVRDVANSGWQLQPMAYEEFLSKLTFNSTEKLLGFIYPHVYAFPVDRVLGTPKFHVLIKGVCSGAEGMALIALLTIAWLVFARRELRMERAILLVPISIAVMWAMNLLRLVILIAIGDAGHPKTAVNGFHSAAGWVSFNAVSAVFLLVATRISWFREEQEEQKLSSGDLGYGWRNVPAIYLGPFLAIVAASFITLASTGGFEWLYPLRFLAALAMLWVFRREYRAMDWRGGWLGVLCGIFIAGLWLLVRLKTHLVTEPPDVTAMGLAQLPPVERYGWIAIRLLAAFMTVPVAEELAFRGFAARRVSSSDVESIPYERLSVAGIVVSSVLFGVLHGEMWFMGIVAGVAYALVAKVRGRLGEAVVAHGVTNLLIAMVALAMKNYTLW